MNWEVVLVAALAALPGLLALWTRRKPLAARTQRAADAQEDARFTLLYEEQRRRLDAQSADLTRLTTEKRALELHVHQLEERLDTAEQECHDCQRRCSFLELVLERAGLDPGGQTGRRPPRPSIHPPRPEGE